ncbi:MAG TPA: 50S ribosomal protein L2, partial [archaeon]|nr:50S ribosomal protein L2 [archaeon]
QETLRAVVTDLVHDPARTSVLAEVTYDTPGFKEVDYLLAPEGIAVGDVVELGSQAPLRAGNFLPLEKIPAGMPAFNLERIPGDGGRIARASGSYALIVGKQERGVLIKLPSRKSLLLDPQCRATLGCSAGGGRVEVPFVKAGKKFYTTAAKNKLWPKVRGVKMNAVSHKHGGKQHHVGKSTTVSRNARPGQKVGHIAASRTGRKKR